MLNYPYLVAPNRIGALGDVHCLIEKRVTDRPDILDRVHEQAGWRGFLSAA